MTGAIDPWFKRYRWLQMLGTGGMGVIYLAEDTQNDNLPCVVKQLNSKYSDPDEMAEAVRLFQREALLLSSLDHPGVVHFFDHHSSEGKYYLVMEYVPGSSLESVINDFGPFDEDDAVKVGIQICEVLEYLHEQNPPIIYRDLKPSNLMLTPTGQIVFIDFGIARTFMPKESATRVVTAGYSPPEQYFGKPETRSDLYALGATLGHLITGARPKPLTATLPSQVKPTVLPSIDQLVSQLTAHSPEDRPLTARHVRHSLYRIYQELHPEFEIPDEVFTDRNSTTKEEQYISQKIMKSGMAAAASALRQEQEHEEKRRKVSQEAPAKASFDRLRAHYKDGDSSSSRNKSVSSRGESGNAGRNSSSNANDKQRLSTSAEKQKVSSATNKLTRSGKQGRESISEAASQMRSVRDLKPVNKRNPIERLFGWLGGLVKK